MKARGYRLIAEMLVLAALILSAVRAAAARFTPDGNWLWGFFALALAALAGIGLYFRYLRRLQLIADISLLRGTLYDLVILMEQYPVKASSRRAGGRAEILERFAIEGASKVGAGKPMPMGDTAALDVTTLGFELIDRNEKDGSDHWRRVNGIRRGLRCWLALVELRDPGLAYRVMVEHMKAQRTLEKGVDNFTEFKTLLGLPTIWPTGDLPERCGAVGITLERAEGAMAAVEAGLGVALDGLIYRPWPDKGQERPEFTGTAIFEEMREYVR